MATQLDVGSILDRCRAVLGVESDADLGRHFGKPRTTVSNWRQRGTVPLEELVQLHDERGVDLSWLLTGQGSPSMLEEHGTYDVRRPDGKFGPAVDRVRETHKLVADAAEAMRDPPDLMQLAPVRHLAYSTRMNETHVKALLDLLYRARQGEFWLEARPKPIDFDLVVAVVHAVDDGLADRGEGAKPRAERADLYRRYYQQWMVEQGGKGNGPDSTSEKVVQFIRKSLK